MPFFKAFLRAPKGRSAADYNGYPVNRAHGYLDSRGWVQDFQNGSRGHVFIMRLRGKDAFVVRSGMLKTYWKHAKKLGYAITDEYPIKGGAEQIFQNGKIVWTNGKGGKVVLGDYGSSCKDTLANPYKTTAAIVTQQPGGSFSHTDYWNRHAWDLDNQAGDDARQIYANCKGTVVLAGAGGWGTTVVVRDDASGKCWVYGHLSSTSVRVNDRVGRDTVIGRQGATGHATASHLHISLHDCDPRSAIQVGASIAAKASF